MPSGMGGMGTGSDTRMYAPRSESTNMYSGDDSYRYGIGDPKAMEEYRDKKQKEKESAMSLNDLPHLKVEIDKPDMPMMPPMPPPPSDMGPPIMDDDNENAVGAEVSQMTGMPDMGNLSMANASGLVPSGSGQLVAMSEPMDLAWRLLKKEGEPWYQKPFDSEMREKEKLTQTHAKLSESSLPRSKKKTGLDRAHLSVHYGHRGKGRIRPLTLEPEKYAQYQGQRQQRALGGNIAMPKSLLGRAPSGERDARQPSESSPAKQLQIKEPTVRAPKGPPKIKDMTIKSMKDDIADIRKKMSYMEFNQLRRLLRRLQSKVRDREQSLKAHAAPGEINEVGHRDGGTTNPQGATENIETEEVKSENSGRMFVAPGSGRTA